MECVEAQETLLHREPRSTSRMGGAARVASLMSATALLAIGGKAAWGGMPISESEVMGASQMICSNDGESCAETRCCNSHSASGGYKRCWRKDEYWASCNDTCDSNMKWETDAWVHTEEKGWDCHLLDVAEDGENCMESKKCKNAESRCYLKNEHWASCNATCSPNNQWNSESSAWEQTEEPVWNCKDLACTKDGENCLDSRCCQNDGSTCFRKNEHWASCNATCTSSYQWTDGAWEDKGEGEKIWSCEVLLPKDHDDEPACDLSECDGCQGEHCTSCREDKERDCCLENFCKAQGEQVAECKKENLDTCCEGKSEECTSLPIAEQGMTEACELDPESPNCTAMTDMVYELKANESATAVNDAERNVKGKHTDKEAACKDSNSHACAKAVTALEEATLKESEEKAKHLKDQVDIAEKDEKLKCGSNPTAESVECRNAKNAALAATKEAINAIKEANMEQRKKDAREHQIAEAESMQETDEVDAALQRAIDRLQDSEEMEATGGQ